MEQATAYPDGIGERHLAERGPAGVRWLTLAALGAILVAALSGAFGGGRNPQVRVSGTDGALAVTAPQTLRNGEFFEMRMRVDARTAIGRPTLAVSAAYWHDLTINTMIPAPADESFAGGFYLFEFAPLAAGESLELKVDGQVNPPLFGGTEGTVALRDGERDLAAVPLRMRVLP